MKTLILSALLVASSAFAADDCYSKLLNNQMDSAHFKVGAGLVVSNDSEKMDPQMAVNAVNYIYQQLECSDVTPAKVEDVKCSSDLTPWSLICKLNGPGGYFIVLKDYVDGVNILFNRWD